ncbi:MAG: glycosyltransferase, partial [Veillonella sp.]|nr:glycosyltransferase [Veillonella sp.]
MSKISVIVPIYNVEPYIHQCVDSIINQTYKDLEIILVDDGSPDNCGKICDEYAAKDDRVKVIHRPNGGLSAARNSGLDVATGEYIAFVDSDDYIACNMYSDMMEFMLKHKLDIVVCSSYRVKNSKIKEEKYTYEETTILTQVQQLQLK